MNRFPREDQRPNVLLIISDQHRFDYIGCAGASYVRTPNIDTLASEGLRFTRCYTNAPICAPARISLATGRDPWSLAAHDNSARLRDDAVTVYQAVRDNHYRVGLVGKADLDKPDRWNGPRGDRPQVYRWGFTHPVEVEGKMHAAYAPSPIGPYGYMLAAHDRYERFYQDYRSRREKGWLGPDGWSDSVLEEEFFADRYIGREAERWLHEITPDYPWLLQVGFVGPHDPYDPPNDVADRYRQADAPSPSPASNDQTFLWVQAHRSGFTAGEIATGRRQYAAAVEVIDDEVGRLLAALEDSGQRARTLVIFVSDHGDLLGDHGVFQKTAPYDGAARVPLIVSGPGVATGSSDAIVELADLAPTLCDITGTRVPAEMTARSFASVLLAPNATHRANAVLAASPFQAIVAGDYKLIRDDEGFVELYDLAADPDEVHNLAATHDGIADELTRQLDSRLRGEEMGDV